MAAYLTIAQICQHTGFSRGFVRAEMKRGNLKHGRVGRRVAVSVHWFRKWMEGQASDSHEPSKSLPDQAISDAEILAAMERLETRMAEIGEDIAAIKSALMAREAALRESLG